MKKEELFAKLRSNTREQFDMPDLTIKAITYPDTVKQFIEMSQTVGGKVKCIKKEDDINQIIRELYPEAKVFASNVPGINADLNPDTVAEAKDLNGTDVGILQGELGVAENGCIWIPQTMKEKAICFISEELVILLDKKNIVNNMHEGYKRIRVPELGYGCWISGPSKTARGVTVLLIG